MLDNRLPAPSRNDFRSYNPQPAVEGAPPVAGARPWTFSQMDITPKRIVRFILGAVLPVPLFIGIYYFSYFYTSYHGFDHESQSYMTSPSDIAITRQHLKTDALVFLATGYFLMGIPSLVYSFLLECQRSCPRFKMKSYVIWGG